MRNLLCILLLFICPCLPVAAIDVYEFRSEEEHQRYQHLIDEMRCPKCQNQNLSGSDSPIAQDLRREIHRMLEQNHSDQEIIDFMVARYGEYVLYRPPLQRSTLVLWGLPLLLLGVGVILLLIIARTRRPGRAPDAELSETELDRLQALKAQVTKDDQ